MATPEVEEVLGQLGQVEDAEAGLPLDLADDLSHAFGSLGCDHEPHVERVIALVVMRHLGMRIHHLGHSFEVLGWSAQCRKRERAAHPCRVVHRTESRERAVGKQPLQSRRELDLRDAERPCDRRKRTLADVDPLLQPVHDSAVDAIHGRKPRARRTARPSA